MNPFEMVIGIVLIVTIGSIIRTKYGVRRDNKGNEYFVGNPGNEAETKALQAEIRALKDRIQVLGMVPEWTKGRDFPAPEGKTFRELYAQRAARRR